MKNRSNEWHKKKRQEELADDPDAIECLICGKKYIQVCTHVVQAHDMTAREYKDKFCEMVKEAIDVHAVAMEAMPKQDEVEETPF